MARFRLHLRAALLALPLTLGLAALLYALLPPFGALPQGESLSRLRALPYAKGGYVRNIARSCGLPIPKGAMPWARQRQKRYYTQILWEAMVGSGRPGERPEKPLPVVLTNLRELPRERNGIVWFGHSSCLLQLGGKRILVDPVFNSASPIPGTNPPFEGTEVYDADDMPEVDVLLITHDHYDHLDYKAVCALRDRVGKVICPLGLGAHFRLWGYEPERITELAWGEHAELPGLRVNAHTSYHYSGRNVNTRRRALWASYVVQGGGKTLYLSGDSGYATHFAALGKQYGGFDYAVMENGQYSPHWQQNHMLPHELPPAIRDLGARRVLTVHHSKYKLSPHPWQEPLENALRLRENGVAVDIPRIGEPVWFDEAPKADSPPWWRAE